MKLKKRRRLFCSAKVLLILALGCFALQQVSASVPSKINWPDFLARHDLVWKRAPMAWHDGPFLGNGMLGSMLHQMDDHTLRISLGRADVEDHKTSGGAFIAQSRLPNGYFTLKTVGEITGFDGRLDLYNAETRVRIQTDKGYVDLCGLVHSNDMVIFYELKPSAGEVGIQLDFVPLKAIAPARLQAELEVAKKGERATASRKKWAASKYQYNPDPVLTNLDGYNVSRQALAAGGENGTAWIIKDADKGAKQLFVSIEHSFPKATATVDAVSHLKKIENESLESFIKRHRAWWHAYYPKSFISLDDTRMESFYWIQVYKFGAGARKGRAFMDTMGPWMVENTAWANGWFNLNTQLSYWFLSTANRMEVAESLFTKLDEKLPTLVANMPKEYGDQCAGMSTITPQTFISKFPSGRLGFTGELLWTCHDYWLMLERTMDAQRTKEKFFPLLKKSVNTYLHFMVEGQDGKVHLPHTRSPEYGEGEDCNFNLALFRWGLATLIHIDERYKINDPLLPKWKDVHARLVDYPTNETGFMVAKDFPFAKAHRHYSHLLMIYPLGLIHMEQPENRELIKKSVKHWTSFFTKGVTGYSYSGAAAMYALQGDGEQAAKYLDMFMRMHELFPDNPTRIHPTTMYTETARIQPVTETPLSLCDSMQLMLLQSWGGTIRVFPAVPDSWKNICFDGLLAAGGFEVGAARKEGVTQFVRIKSLAGEPCRLKTDLKLKRMEGIPKSAVKKIKDGMLQINMKKGEEVILYGQDVDQSVVNPVDALPENSNTFGLNNRRLMAAGNVQKSKNISGGTTSEAEVKQEVSLKEAHEGTLEIDLKIMNQFVSQAQDVQYFYIACREALVGKNPDRDVAELCRKFNRRKIGGPMLGDIAETSVSIWLHLPEPSGVRVTLTREGSDSGKTVKSNTTGRYLSIHCDGLLSDTAYAYEVVRDPSGERLGEGRFVTATSEASKRPFRIAFGGDFHKIGLYRPELMNLIQDRGNRAMLLVGDLAIDGRRGDLALTNVDYLLRDFSPVWQRFSANVPVYAAWDDHDYYGNDTSGAFSSGGKVIPVKALRQNWKEHWNNPERDGAQAGIYFQSRIGPVHLILLDTRSCREGDHRGKLNSFLGVEQMDWLKKQITASTAPYILLSSGTMWSDYISNGKDSWGTWDIEGREAIFRLIDQKKDSQVILLSGDRHGARGFAIPRPGNRKLYEFEVGTLGGVPGPNSHGSNTENQLFGYTGRNTWAFGEFTFGTEDGRHQVTFRLINEKGEELESIVLENVDK